MSRLCGLLLSGKANSRALEGLLIDQLKPSSSLNYKGTATDICLPVRGIPRTWKLTFLVAMTIFCNVSKNALHYEQASTKSLSQNLLKIFSSESPSAPDQAMSLLSLYLGILKINHRC